MSVSDAKRLFANSMLENEVIEEALQKNGGPSPGPLTKPSYK